MGLFKGFRARAQQKFERDLGANPDIAALGAIALHPFVNGSPRPKRSEFATTIRADSHRFTRDVRDVRTSEQLRELARPVVAAWARSAVIFGEGHYRKEFEGALTAASHIGPDGVPGRSRSLAEVLEEDEELRAEFEKLDEVMERRLADPRELARPSRKLAIARMDSARDAGIPEEDILQGEDGIAQLEAMVVGITPAERRIWLEGLHPPTRTLGLIAIEAVEADERAGYID